jgi:diguanylate cyclase (GGDEF)-like protein
MKFRTKAVLGVMLIQAVLLSVLVLSVLSQMRTACRQELEHRASVTAQLLAAAARDPMVAYDVSTLESLATDLVHSGQVAYVQFLDDEEKYMASFDAKSAAPTLNPPPQPASDNMLERTVPIQVAGKNYGRVRFGIQLDETEATLDAIKKKTIANALGVMAAVALFSLFLGRLLTSHLKDLSIASHEIASGNLSHRVNDLGHDELAETARNFNSMAARLSAVSQAHESALEKLRAMAYYDPLTSAHNRRSFLAALEEELQRVQRTQSPSALIMLDIDHFKDVNDTWGHDTGDMVLKHLVTVLQSNLRRIDTLGRLGGEEFAVLLPSTTLEGAVELAERLRLAVQESPALRPGVGNAAPQPVSFTISVGVAAVDPSRDSADRLLKRADVAMYESKTTGRNKVCVAH